VDGGRHLPTSPRLPHCAVTRRKCWC
jgi:hypothetical protein